MVNNDSTTALIALGLNGSQARTYLALLENETSSVREVSKITQISRPDTYRAIIALEGMGLIERVITCPIKYKPLALEEALAILMGRKEKEITELKQKARELNEYYKTKAKPQVLQNASQQFILIPEGEALAHKLQKMVEGAQKSICIMLSQKKLLPWLLYDETIGEALERGITVKILTESNSGLRIPKGIAGLRRKHSFEIRYMKTPLPVCFRIYDSKEVMLTTATTSDAKEPSSVWSNNASFLELVQTYFDVAWFSAIDPIEQEFKHDERQFDYLLANLKGGFSYNRIIFNSDGHPEDFIVLVANECFLSMFNITKDDLGKRATQLFPDMSKESSLIFGRIAQGEVAQFEYHWSIHERWYSFLAYSPEKGYFVLMSENITERKEAEEKISVGEKKYRQLFNSMPSGVAVYEAVDNAADFVIVDFNQTAGEIEGLSKQDVVGKSVTEVFRGVKELGLLSVLQRVFQTGQSEYLPASVYSDTKRLSWRENWVYKLPNGNVVAVYNDVTERKKTEEALHSSEEKYRELINGMNDSVWVIDFNHKFIDVNNAAVELYGYSREELLSMSVFAIDQHFNPREIIKTHEGILSESLPKVLETIHTTKGGKKIPVELSLTTVTYLGKKAILSVSREISKRKKLTDALLEKIQLNQALLDAFPCVALLVRPGTREIVASNKMAVEVGAVPGKTCYETWGKRESPCPWCLAPKLWESQKTQHLEVKALGVVWDAYWVPAGKDLYMHYAFDITQRSRLSDITSQDTER